MTTKADLRNDIRTITAGRLGDIPPLPLDTSFQQPWQRTQTNSGQTCKTPEA